MEEQVFNCGFHTENGVTKYQFILDRIEVEDRSAVLELGCAPGRLLMLLANPAGFQRVVGIEAVPEFEEEIRDIGCFSGELLFGLFPGITVGYDDETFSCIIALDLWEHMPDQVAFLKECARLLKRDGQLMMMCPLVDIDCEPPERFFAPDEHIWLTSIIHAHELLRETGFERIVDSAWCSGHEFLSARKR